MGNGGYMIYGSSEGQVNVIIIFLQDDAGVMSGGEVEEEGKEFSQVIVPFSNNERVSSCVVG